MTATAGRAEFHALPSMAAPADARRWVREAAIGSALSHEFVEDTVLIVDELVMNAVAHGGAPIAATLEFSDAFCRCSVSDGGLDGPLPRLVERADGTGRGLRIVAAIASRWGVERSHRGTTVWVELAM